METFLEGRGLAAGITEALVDRIAARVESQLLRQAAGIGALLEAVCIIRQLWWEGGHLILHGPPSMATHSVAGASSTNLGVWPQKPPQHDQALSSGRGFPKTTD